MVIFVEPVTTTQSPSGLVIWRPSTTLPFPPMIVMGPDGVRGGGRAEARTCTVALADREGAATLLAVTVTAVLLDTTGAVNKPAAEMVPAVAVQVPALLVVFATVAVNNCVPCEETVAEAGETVTEMGGGRLLASTVWVADPVKFDLSVAATLTAKDPVFA